MNDVMVDLETLGVTPQAPIVSIGAVFFDIEQGLIGNSFYMILKLDDQLIRGRKLDADTLRWWFNQAEAAKKVFNEKAQLPTVVLNTLAQWINSNKSAKRVKVWGNGSTFDISMLEDIFRLYGIGCPWGYSDIMDLRTFKRFVAKGQDVEKTGIAHNALDDAVSQAKYVIYHTRPPNKYGSVVTGVEDANRQGS